MTSHNIIFFALLLGIFKVEACLFFESISLQDVRREPSNPISSCLNTSVHLTINAHDNLSQLQNLSVVNGNFLIQLSSSFNDSDGEDEITVTKYSGITLGSLRIVSGSLWIVADQTVEADTISFPNLQHVGGSIFLGTSMQYEFSNCQTSHFLYHNGVIKSINIGSPNIKSTYVGKNMIIGSLQGNGSVGLIQFPNAGIICDPILSSSTCHLAPAIYLFSDSTTSLLLQQQQRTDTTSNLISSGTIVIGGAVVISSKPLVSMTSIHSFSILNVMFWGQSRVDINDHESLASLVLNPKNVMLNSPTRILVEGTMGLVHPPPQHVNSLESVKEIALPGLVPMSDDYRAQDHAKNCHNLGVLDFNGHCHCTSTCGIENSDCLPIYNDEVYMQGLHHYFNNIHDCTHIVRESNSTCPYIQRRSYHEIDIFDLFDCNHSLVATSSPVPIGQRPPSRWFETTRIFTSLEYVQSKNLLNHIKVFYDLTDYHDGLSKPFCNKPNSTPVSSSSSLSLSSRSFTTTSFIDDSTMNPINTKTGLSTTATGIICSVAGVLVTLGLVGILAWFRRARRFKIISQSAAFVSIDDDDEAVPFLKVNPYDRRTLADDLDFIDPFHPNHYQDHDSFDECDDQLPTQSNELMLMNLLDVAHVLGVDAMSQNLQNFCQSDMNLHDMNNRTLLHTAAMRPEIDDECFLNVLTTSLSSHINDRDCQGLTALHYASQNNHAVFCTVLCQHRADINACDSLDRTALMLATLMDHVEALDVLLAHKAFTIFVDDNGWDVFWWAAICGSINCVGRLIDSGFSVKFRVDKKGSSLKTLLIARGSYEMINYISRKLPDFIDMD